MTDARLVKLLAIPMVVVGCISIVRGCSEASATERPGAYEIVAYRAGKDLREDQPNLVVISGPFGREECRIAIASVKLANGSRLRCDKVEERRVR